MGYFGRAVSSALDFAASSAAYHLIADFEYLASRSHFIGACRKSPGGFYPLELVYRNEPQGATPIECFADWYYLNAPLARAARSRLKSSIGWLQENTEQVLQNRHLVHILSLACGSARDACLAFAGNRANGSISYLGIDIDPEAVKFAHNLARKAGLCGFRFEHGNALRPLPAIEYQFNLITSLGLFDYLQDRTIKNLLDRLHSILAENGRLLFGAVTVNPSMRFFENQLGWRMQYRSAEHILRLAHESKFAQIKIASNSKDRFLLVECTK